MKYRFLWAKILNWLAILSFFLLLSGFGLAVQEILEPAETNNITGADTEPFSPSPSKDLLLGLGDSLTRGVGDKNGLGYFGIIKKEWLAKADNSSRAINLSIRGQTSQNLLDQLKKAQTKRFVKEADIIVITIGGNDLFRAGRDIEHIDIHTIKKRKEQFKYNLTAILSEIHQLNPECSIYLLGLYNPFGDLTDSSRTSTIVADWNHAAIVAAQSFNQVTVVPVYDLFHKNPQPYLYSDHFHPNEKGYQEIADRLRQVINTAGLEVASPHAANKK